MTILADAPPSLLCQLARSHSQAQIAQLTGVSERTVRRWLTGETATPKHVDVLLRAELGRAPARATFTFVDLFAGIGGTRLGYESVGGKCVFTSEWNKYSEQTYVENFGTSDGHVFAGDITRVAAEEVPDHDVLIGGFPCQPFSIAGVSKKNALGRPHGFQDATQGTLFFDVARIIDEKRPRAFMLENVKNLMSHDRGRTFRTIVSTLRDELGYDVHHRVIDASPWVPQMRKRIFIVGFRDGNDFSFDDLPVPETRPVMRDILHPQDGSELPERHYTEGLAATVSDRYTLTPHLWTYLRNYATKHKAAGNGFGFGLVGPDDVARTLSARYYKDGSEILVEQPGRQPRRLTPRECARLMGFPDTFRIPVSDTQAYKQFGNSIVVPVVEAVASLVAAQLK